MERCCFKYLWKAALECDRVQLYSIKRKLNNIYCLFFVLSKHITQRQILKLFRCTRNCFFSIGIRTYCSKIHVLSASRFWNIQNPIQNASDITLVEQCECWSENNCCSWKWKIIFTKYSYVAIVCVSHCYAIGLHTNSFKSNHNWISFRITCCHFKWVECSLDGGIQFNILLCVWHAHCIFTWLESCNCIAYF